MIRYYSGVEGSGKSCMMTRDLYLHYLSGGRVLSFPGYELYGARKTQVLSEVITPDQILQLLKAKTKEEVKILRALRIALAMDEVSNYFNHHNWYNKICDILYAILAERRKLNIAVTMTGPKFETLPPDIRGMVHELVECWDKHTFNRSYPRGVWCSYRKRDLRGMLANPFRPFSGRRRFYMKTWYKHYDSFSVVDSLSQFIKINIKGKVIVYDGDGNLISGEVPEGISLEEAARYALSPKVNPVRQKVIETVNYFRGKGIDYIESENLERIFPNVPLRSSGGLGALMKQLGATYNGHKKIYNLSNIGERMKEHISAAT